MKIEIQVLKIDEFYGRNIIENGMTQTNKHMILHTKS